MQTHIIESDVVVNTIVATIEEAQVAFPNATCIDASIGGSIGDKIIDGVIVPYAPSPPTADQQRNAIQTKIDDLEKSSLENRGSRELHLREMEREAAAQAAAISTPDVPVTADQVLAMVPYYAKLKMLNDQITALRSQL